MLTKQHDDGKHVLMHFAIKSSLEVPLRWAEFSRIEGAHKWARSSGGGTTDGAADREGNAAGAEEGAGDSDGHDVGLPVLVRFWLGWLDG